ncbi:MAG: NAD-dependent epimerase/dehydratase family protein [Anaerolineae bacterium]
MILVTGATGFLGRNLCEHLARQGYRLRALARPTSDVTFLEALGAEIAIGDVRDLDSVRTALAGCDMVIHAAARFRLWGPPELVEEINLWGTRNMLATAYAQGVRRFVHVSTIIVVGPQPPGTIITEATPYSPYHGDNYARTKMGGERLALSYAEIGLPVIVLRPGALYGPWGHEAALTRGRMGEVYNVSGKSITHREANETVSRLAGKSSWRIDVPASLMINLARLLEFIALFTQREPFYPLNLVPYVFEDWHVCSDKARRELGFEPVSFEEGARQTLEWYGKIGFI